MILLLLYLTLATGSPYNGNSTCGPLPDPPRNGYYKEMSGQNDVIVMCNKGYYPEGSPLIKCNQTTRSWIINDVSCFLKTCGYPGEPRNGKKLGTLFRVGDTVTYKCDPCYNLKGVQERVCMKNQKWTGSLPSCEPVDCRPLINASFINGKVYGSATTLGSIFSFYCNSGYYLVGSKRITCQCNGQWNGKIPSCQKEKIILPTIKECLEPTFPKNGYIISNNKKRRYQTGDVAKYICIYQYELIGPKSRTCQQNGTWSGTEPICKAAYCDDIEADAPEHGKRSGRNRIGDSYTYACDVGYKLLGHESITCLSDAQWSAEGPICEAICDSLQCDPGKKCVFDGELKKPFCTCMDNLDCSALYEPVCGSDGKSYNSECIMKATGCRLTKFITKVADGYCIPGGICSIKPVSKCRGYFEVFYYNKEKRQCEEIVVGGCHKSGWNGFETLSDCQQTCINSFCQRPAVKGPCLSFRKQWYFNSTFGVCRTFQYGGCYGNQNNFDSEAECMSYCSPATTATAPLIKILSAVETKRCPPCGKSKGNICDALKSNHLTILGKVALRSTSSLEIRVDRVLKDTHGHVQTQGKQARLIIRLDGDCPCVPVIPEGPIIVSSNFIRQGNDVTPAINRIHFAKKFYGEKQLRCD